jgi:exodeoxyribonuclease-3
VEVDFHRAFADAQLAADVAVPEAWTGDALFQPQSRGAFRALKNLGLTDAYMQMDGSAGGYTFWDYQAGAWPKDHGIRIDHHLLSPQAADRLTALEIHRDVRGWEKPSDHVPVVASLAF